MASDRSFGAQLVSWADALVERLIVFGRKTTPALVIGAAIFAYFNQPVIRFIDTYPAYEGGAVIAIGLLLVVAAMTVRRSFIGIIVGIAGFVVGTMWIGDALDVAVARSAQNDVRCYRIETEMLSDRPPRTDLPDLYQALGCRPMTALYTVPKPTLSSKQP